MPKPINKKELQELSLTNYDRLLAIIKKKEGLALHEFPEGTLNRNIRDVLAHIHHWHLLFLEWYAVGMAGEKPVIPAKGYTWKTTPLLNQSIRKQYKELPFNKIVSLLEASHTKIQNLIESHSDIELFEKKKYHWTGSTSLGAYLISSTSSHYDWGYKLIKKATKNFKN